MRLSISHQEQYSRGELLLRTFFGALYIMLPHQFLLMFVGLWGGILSMISWWVVLFTGKYPKSFFNYQIKLLSWKLRVSAVLNNLVDGYPAFGLNGSSDNVRLEVEYPETLSRGVLLLRAFFGVIYIYIPHGFMLLFRIIATNFIVFLAWWVVLFTGKYPVGMHSFNVGTFRWMTRLNLYAGFLTDEYPPFSGKE